MTTPELSAREAIAAEVAALNAAPRTYFLGERVTVEIQSDRVDVNGQHPNENSMSMAAFNGLVRGVGLPSGITPAAAAEFVTDNADLISRVMVGMDKEWDGSNMVGTLTEDAAAALEELRELGAGLVESASSMWAHGEIVEEMDAAEYLRDIFDAIEAAPGVEAAISEALGTLEDDGVSKYADGLTYVNPRHCEAVARERWELAHQDDE